MADEENINPNMGGGVEDAGSKGDSKGNLTPYHFCFEAKQLVRGSEKVPKNGKFC